MFDDTTDRDKDQVAEIRDLDRMYEGRALDESAPRWWRNIAAAVVVAVLAVEVYAILFLSECWWGCWP